MHLLDQRRTPIGQALDDVELPQRPSAVERIRSQRGCEGGYWLGRTADEVTLLDVVRAVDGELITLRGAPLAGLAYPGPAVGLPGVWRRIESDVAAVLEGMTLSSLLSAGAVEPLARTGAA